MYARAIEPLRENDFDHPGYILYKCPICKRKVLRRKMGRKLLKKYIFCMECGTKLDLR